jgi:tetratricopeptide (TPR) repeat protein
MKTRLCLFSLIIGFALTANGADNDAFAKANKAYAEGRFGEAAANYESLVRAGKLNANLFYDLGNAWYRVGDFGQSILNYERALTLDPRHPEADANLRLARDEARALELRRDWIEHYAGMATVKQYTIAAAVAFWLALFIMAHLFFSRRSAGRIALIALCVIVCGVSIFAIVTLENGTRGDSLAIVTGKDVEARLATADNAKSVLVLPAGSEIKILSERGDWIYAALPNEQRGWIPAANAQRVRM